MREVMNLMVEVPLWAIAVFGLIGLLLIGLDGWRAQQWQQLAILAARIGTRPADTLPDPAGALEAAASVSNPPGDRPTTRSTTA